MQRGNLDDLAAFLGVVRERSFTRAAARLGVSQSALSHTIRELEARLGVRLLTRSTRSVSPTEAGERLAANRGPRFEEIEAELASLSALRERPAGTIRSQPPNMQWKPFCCPSSRGSCAKYPDIRVEITLDYGLTDIVAQQYRRGRSKRRAGGKGHDRRAHRSGHAHGGRWHSTVFQEWVRAEEAAGPHWPQLHQASAATHGGLYAWN